MERRKAESEMFILSLVPVSRHNYRPPSPQSKYRTTAKSRIWRVVQR